MQKWVETKEVWAMRTTTGFRPKVSFSENVVFGTMTIYPADPSSHRMPKTKAICQSCRSDKSYRILGSSLNKFCPFLFVSLSPEYKFWSKHQSDKVRIRYLHSSDYGGERERKKIVPLKLNSGDKAPSTWEGGMDSD